MPQCFLLMHEAWMADSRVMMTYRYRPTIFGIALVFATLAKRSRPCLLPAFLLVPSSRACISTARRGCDGKARSRGAFKKPSVSSGPLLTGEETLTLWSRCRPEVSSGSSRRSVRSQRRDGAGKADGTEEKEDERVDRKGHRRKAIETDGDTGVSRTDPTVVDAIEGRTGEAGGAGAGAGGGGGGKRKRGRPAAKGEAKEREKARQRAERSRRITSTLDLVETLANSDVDLIGVLRDFSSSSWLSQTDDRELSEDDRLVGAIARPVLARIRRYRTRDAYLRRQAKKRDGRLQRRQQQQQQQEDEGVPLWSPDAKEIQHVEKEKPFPTTAREIDHFLQTNKVTVWDAIRAYKVLSEGEILRRKKISLRRLDPAKWHAAKMAEAEEKRSRRNDPVYLAQKQEERRLVAVRRYAVRRRNGNSGKGRPRSKADQRKADDLAAARAAAVAAGVATEVDFAAPPKRVFKKDIPTVKRRVGRPRKVLVPPVEEERGISSEERAPVSTPVSCSLRPSSDVVNNRTGVTVGETRVAEAAAAEARGDERQRRHRSSQRGYARAGSTGLEGQGSRRFEDDGGSDPEAGGRGGGGAVAGGASPRASDEGHAPPEVERNLATEGSAGRPPR